LKLSRFPRRIRFGWETEPTGPGSETIVVSKIDTYGAVSQPHRASSGNYQIEFLIFT